MARTLLFLLTASLAFWPATPDAQHQPAATDLDALMQRVLARRDENWKKLRQYVLGERERFVLTGPDGARLYGFDRDYTWFMRNGIFVRSPLRFDGVTLSEDERRRYEDEWQRVEQRREARARERANAAVSGDSQPTEAPSAEELEAMLGGASEPRFVSAAYFLRFKFEQGSYALVGRERVLDREALRIEYYPARLFSEGRTRPSRRMTERDREIERKLNKVSLVTLWVDPDSAQILQYAFDDVDMDFLPARWLIRLDDAKATMRLQQAFENVWLPSTLDIAFRMTLAVGPVAGSYSVEYHDYKLADVTVKIP